MRLLSLCAVAIMLTAAARSVPADEPAKLDPKKFTTDYYAARARSMNALKTPPGEQPPFDAIRELMEQGLKFAAAHPDDADAKSIRRTVVNALTYYPACAEARKLLDKATDPLTAAEKAAAMVSLARSAMRDAGKPGVSAKEVARMCDEAETLLVSALKDADGPAKRQAETSLFIVRNLSVGKQAPEVVSKDLDGKEVKLSDYRGKVVVLDVWFTGCMPCRAMIPHQRELVDRLKDRPFALISVSGDQEKEKLTKFLEETRMPWTHWYNGPKGGMIEDWKITYFPTIYVLDAKGVIRYTDVRGTSLDKAVDTLLAEMKDSGERKN